jgi:hypothetical protein
MSDFCCETYEDRILMDLSLRFLNVYPFYEDHYNYGVKELMQEEYILCLS